MDELARESTRPTTREIPEEISRRDLQTSSPADGIGSLIENGEASKTVMAVKDAHSRYLVGQWNSYSSCETLMSVLSS
jgi:hypothetical protein